MRLIRNRLCIALMAAAFVAASPAWAQLPFFPGAEGYGGTWSGTAPAGGWLSTATVYHVTNLNDSGAGSFRGAFAENTTNKIIVFDVAGTIKLTSGKLDIKNLSNYYIAGQTAPGPVTVYGDMVQLTHSGGKENRNVVLRYLTFRKDLSDNDDSITFAGSGLGTNLIFDHVSASWSEDELMSVTNGNTNITVQYNMLNDALTNDHAYGSLLRAKIDSNVSVHHNLYANNKSRQARFGSYLGETLTADFRNNVVYNWGDRASYAGGSDLDDGREFADVNYVGNYLLAGPSTTPAAGAPYVRAEKAFIVDKNISTRVYQSGNAIDSDRAVNPGGVPNGSDTGWNMFYVETAAGKDGTLQQMATPFATPAVTTQTAAAAYDQVINHVGNWWWNRGAIDQRVIDNVRNYTGPTIGLAAPPAAELAGVTGATLVTRPAGWDADADGMPDAWESAHGLNPNSAADNKLDFDNDGYINVIEYINEAGEFPAPAPIVFNGATSTRYAQITNWKTNDGGVTAGTNWQPSKYDTAVVRNNTVAMDSVGQHAGTLQVGPTTGDVATLNVTAGWIDVAQSLNVGAGGAATVNHSGGLVVANAVVLGGTAGASGVYNLSGTGQLAVNALSKGTSGGAFNMTGGTLAANTVAFDLVNNGGTITPGASPGSTHIVGNLTNASGKIKMELAGTAAGQFDEIIVDGALAAGGILEVTLLGAYTPAAGATFDLFDFTSASGLFALQLPTLTGGLQWNTSNLLTTGELKVQNVVANNADFNDDGIVDGADLLVWQRGLGLQNQNDKTLGDANGDRVVDALDLAAWRTQFGTSLASPAGAAVPEPAAALLAMIALALGVARGRR